MARKRYSDEDVLNLLRQIELSLASGSSVETACRSAGIIEGSVITAPPLKLSDGWHLFFAA